MLLKNSAKSNDTRRKLGVNIIIDIVVASIYYVVYSHLSGLGGKNILLVYLPTLLVLGLLQASLKKTIFTPSYLFHGIVGIAWSLAFPVLNHPDAGGGYGFTEIMGNYFFGLGIFATLVLAQYMLTNKWGKGNLWAGIFTFLDFLFLVIPVAQLCYFLKYEHGLTLNSMFAIYQTNPHEAIEYINSGASGSNIILFCIVSLVVLIGAFFLNRRIYVDLGSKRGFRHKWPVLILFIIISVVFFAKANIVNTFIKIDQYTRQLQSYHSKHQEIYDKLTVNKQEATITKTPGTIIVVIGESASRDNMTVYNPLTPFADTPWMSKERATNPNFHFFNHAYTSWPQTVPSLERALTERNQYQDKDFMKSASIVDVAKKLGYHTYWFSNQGVFGRYDTTTSLIAKTSEVAKWAHENSFSGTDTYDEALLPLLKSVNPHQNNFIVLHVMGNHQGYKLRYPASFDKFKDSPLAPYYNSMIYGDYVLEQIFDYAKANLNLQAMVYFSDHGEDMILNHNPDTFTFSMARIPLWVYTSPEYAKAYPATVDTLKKHEDTYFTNDLLYDLVVGLLHAQGNTYVPTRDLSNLGYNYTPDTLTTMFGKYKLTQDPMYKTNDIDIQKIYVK